MRQSLAFAVAALLALAGPALAQPGSGGLPQQVRRGMEMAMQDLDNKSLLVTRENMSEEFGEEEMTAFLDGAVVRLILFPDGKYEVYSLSGGEVVSFKLGKESVSTGQEGFWEDEWFKKSGEYEIAKRSQYLSLILSAGPQKVAVNCFNQYRKKDGVVTYYVGPLDGLFCLGLTEDEEATG
ncbi:MAG: hypothetical protein WBH85_20385 [Thermoanaerobaculia bacterium]